MSTTPDSTLDPQQLIAELQRQLAESNAERDENQAQKEAMAEVLGVINASPGDLAPVFDAMLEKAMRLCEADFGGLWTYDGGNFRSAAMSGVPEPFAEFCANNLVFGPGSGPARLVEGEPFNHVVDLTASEAYLTGEPNRKALVDLGGARTALAVPLRKDDALVGLIMIYRQEVRPFSDKQIALLQNFAAQAVIAMENARLITETREALEQQTATAQVLEVINSSPGDLAPVFDAILEKARSLCGAVHGALVVYDGKHFRAVATHGLPEPLEGLLRTPYRPNPVHQALLRGERLIHIADQAAVETDTSIGRASVDAGARTLLLVPLRKDGALLGYITASRWEVRPFSDKEIALLENFAAQAVIAIENARLITETREALEQQTATAEVLQVINSSPGNIASIFDAMLEKALRLCGAEFGMMNTFDGEHFHHAADRGVPAAYASYRRRRDPMIFGLGTAPTRLLEGENLVHAADLKAAEPYQRGDPNSRALVDLGGVRSHLCVALRKGDILLGDIVIYRQEVLPFSDKQIALLQNFAAQAVIAMENARLITETREALEQQTATAEILGVISSSPGDLGPVFDRLVEKATRLCDAAFGHLYTYDGELFHFGAVHGDARYVEARRRGGPRTRSSAITWERMIEGEAIVHIVDCRDTEAYRGNPEEREAIERAGTRSLLTVALRRDETLLGILSVYRQEVRPFTDKQTTLLQNFAAHAVIAIENARLITETREALEQQTATAEVLGVINASPGDLAPVFDAILENAHRLCGIALGELELYENGKVRAVAMRGVSGSFAELLRQPFVPPPGSPPARLLAGERIVQVIDVSELAQDLPDDPRAQTGAQDGLRTALFVPLRKDDALLGYITGYRREVRSFSEKEIALLQNFAAQAVIAMENARLLGELRQRTDEVGALNRDLEARVAEQVDELGRVGRLKRFLAPQLAELIVSHGDEKILESHRREIVVVFCDLRGYTAFTETAEPEEVLDFLREYHGALGPLVSQFEGTLDQFSGDGIMVFFNDPVPCPDPAERAVKMAVAMRSAANTLIADWRERGRDLGFGAGIAQGYATLGQIGFAERSGYTAIGTVCNVAARLCAEAKDGQILLGQRVNVALKGSVATEQLGALTLKGLTQPVIAFNVPLAAIQPALRVIEGGPESI